MIAGIAASRLSQDFVKLPLHPLAPALWEISGEINIPKSRLRTKTGQQRGRLVPEERLDRIVPGHASAPWGKRMRRRICPVEYKYVRGGPKLKNDGLQLNDHAASDLP